MYSIYDKSDIFAYILKNISDYETFSIIDSQFDAE